MSADRAAPQTIPRGPDSLKAAQTLDFAREGEARQTSHPLGRASYTKKGIHHVSTA